MEINYIINSQQFEDKVTEMFLRLLEERNPLIERWIFDIASERCNSLGFRTAGNDGICLRLDSERKHLIFGENDNLTATVRPHPTSNGIEILMETEEDWWCPPGHGCQDDDASSKGKGVKYETTSEGSIDFEEEHKKLEKFWEPEPKTGEGGPAPEKSDEEEDEGGLFAKLRKSLKGKKKKVPKIEISVEEAKQVKTVYTPTTPGNYEILGDPHDFGRLTFELRGNGIDYRMMSYDVDGVFRIVIRSSTDLGTLYSIVSRYESARLSRVTGEFDREEINIEKPLTPVPEEEEKLFSGSEDEDNEKKK